LPAQKLETAAGVPVPETGQAVNPVLRRAAFGESAETKVSLNSGFDVSGTRS
jgi:hypothetical protein